MICRRCSNANSDNQVFCINCGYVLNPNYSRTNISELSDKKFYKEGKDNIYGYIALILSLVGLGNQILFIKNIVIGCIIGFLIYWLAEKSQDDLEIISKIAKILAGLLILISIIQEFIKLLSYI